MVCAYCAIGGIVCGVRRSAVAAGRGSRRRTHRPERVPRASVLRRTAARVRDGTGRESTGAHVGTRSAICARERQAKSPGPVASRSAGFLRFTNRRGPGRPGRGAFGVPTTRVASRAPVPAAARSPGTRRSLRHVRSENRPPTPVERDAMIARPVHARRAAGRCTSLRCRHVTGPGVGFVFSRRAAGGGGVVPARGRKQTVFVLFSHVPRVCTPHGARVRPRTTHAAGRSLRRHGRPRT